MSLLPSSNGDTPSVSAGIMVDMNALVEAFPNYKDPNRVKDDVLDLSKHCQTLAPKRGAVTLSSGRTELLTLHGTFPMTFRGVQYHTPVQVYIPESYPAEPPLCYIVPTPGLSLRVGHTNVNQEGLVSLKYLEGWSASSHNLINLVASMSTVFGAEPPLCATQPPVSAQMSSSSLQGSKKSSPEQGTLQVVCPSYGRTGTKSLKLALEKLGFGPCYHMTSLVCLKGHPQLWLDGFEGRGLPVKKIFKDFKSVSDWPAACFYKEILEANPSAKVVVTKRDPDSWWRSMASSISRKNPAHYSWGTFFLTVLSPHHCAWKHVGLHIKTLHMPEEEAKADYLRHNEEVLAHVPADKLLEFSVKEGWEPLCDFLGVPVPDEPFPKVNSPEEIATMFTSANKKGWLALVATLTVAGVSVAAATFFGGKRAGGALAVTEAVVLTSRVLKAPKQKMVE